MSDPVVDSVELTDEQAEQKARDDLSAGYRKVSGDTVKPEPTPAPEEVKPEATTEVKPEPAPEPPDAWAGVSPVLKEAHQATQKQLDEVAKQLKMLGGFSKEFNEHRADYGRIAAALQRIEAGNAAAKTAAAAPSQDQIAAAAANPEAWAKLKELFKDWSDEFDVTDTLDQRISERIAAQSAELLKQIPKIDVDGIKREVGAGFNQAIASSRGEVIKLARQFARVDAKYPEWESDVNAPEFAAWIDTQKPEVKALANSDLAVDALKMLDMYYDHRKAVERKEKNQSRLAAAVQPQQATSGGPTVLPDEAGLDVGYKRVKHA